MFIGMMLAAALSSQPPHDFQFVGASNASALFVEDTSIVTMGDQKRAWVVGINDPKTDIAKQYPGTYSMMSHEVNCRQRTDAISHLYVYAANGDVLAERANVYPAAPVAPLSAGEIIFNYVCAGTISTDKVAKLHTIADVTDFGTKWLIVYDKAEALGLFKK